MSAQIVVLWTDLLVWLLVLATALSAWAIRRSPPLLSAWRRVGRHRPAMAAATLLILFALVGLLDSLHYRLPLPAKEGEKTAYGVEVFSVLDAALSTLRTRNEKTYSEPLATRLYAKETMEMPNGQTVRDYPRLRYGGQHLGDAEQNAGRDQLERVFSGLAAAVALWAILAASLTAAIKWVGRLEWSAAWSHLWRGNGLAWGAVLQTLAVVLLIAMPIAQLAAGYHVFGTDKVGQDVLYLALKSVRTGLVIGLVTTLVTLPFAVFLGIASGYFGGWVDDLIQYIYTVLNSIPGVLLIAASVLMMQVLIDTHPQWFATSAERADLRLLALCVILGLTKWTGLCRLLRGETLKLRSLDYIQAANAFGVSNVRIIFRHILPNLMHIVTISLVMDFSELVLAEAVLSYIGIGVDPTMTSFGMMVSNARLELGREPVVWWSLATSFVFMVSLVLAANLFADAVREAFDPRVG